MKCPNCGNLIPEGKLLCEVCGEEIQYVPEFDIEIDAQINETLGNIARSFEEQLTQDEESIDKKNEEEFGENDLHISFLNLLQSHKLLLFSILIVILLAVGISFSYRSVLKKRNSYEYQYQLAIEQYDNGQIDEAIAALDRALAIEQDHLDARLLLASYLIENGSENSAESILKELLLTNSDNKRDVYQMLLKLYEQEQEYVKVGELLRSCEYEDVIQGFLKYSASKPVFSVDEGVYDRVQLLKLSSDAEGFIYYTIDGSNPTTNSMVYQKPIILESGDYVVKAIFVNSYGVQSDLETKTYFISLLTPKTPEISLESGVYHEPEMIEVYHDTETKVYYTLDGSTPNKNSLRYTEPIEMLYGMSNLAVIAINKDGIESEVVRRSYQLSVQANFSDSLAIEVLQNNLIVDGIIENAEGKLTNKLGYNTYSVQTVIEQEGQLYYIVCEKYTDTTGKIHDTNNIYAVNANTADLFKARKVKEGQYILMGFE